MKCIVLDIISLLQITVFFLTDAMWIPLSGCNGKMDYLWVKFSETAHGCIKKINKFEKQLVFLYHTKTVGFKTDSGELD